MTGIGQTNFLNALGWAVINSLWQMALLWVLYQVINALVKTRSSHKSLLATFFLFTGFAWFVFTLVSLLSAHSSSASVVAAGFTQVNGNEQLNNWLQSTLPLASVIYLVLLVIPFLRFLRNYRYVQVIRYYGLSKVNVEWRIFVRNLSARMGIRNEVKIWVSELVSSPVTIGYLKPVILVPLAAINHLSTQQLEAILLHELAHIRRYDYILNLLINFIQTILYFNPFTRAFIKIVEKEREKSCDEMVMQFQYDSHEYAAALLILERNHHSYKPLAVAASGKRHDLLDRIENILGIKRKPLVSFNKLAGLFAGLLCIIVLNAVLIMTRPVNGAGGGELTQLSSPFYFFAGELETYEKPADIIIKESPSPEIITPVSQKPVEQLKPKAPQPQLLAKEYAPALITSHPDFLQVSFNFEESPELKQYQVAQVKDAIEASKKVLGASQWKAVEKTIGDVFTMQEKEELRKEYEKCLAKLNWAGWEKKLKDAYNKVDWERVNEQLGYAVTEVRLDSLQRVYALTASRLQEMQVELSKNELKGIPDTDITLQEVECKKVEVQKNLNRVKALRKKTIIRL
jgi:bla regulator protein blaR1